ncbi:MAG: shikimate kinase [Spirochaetes bacterium]|nr:shikimate kinase [Spirochaetota bacterium]
MKTNIVLTGMPGAGKSTVGVLLAKITAKEFIDTDILIQTRAGKPLQTILDESGYLNLRRIEESVLLTLAVTDHVIATGGSVVYSDAGMRHLSGHGTVVFLDVPLDEVRRRVHDFSTRGIACDPAMTLDDLYAERRPLYLRYADIIIPCGAMTHDAVAAAVIAASGH